MNVEESGIIGKTIDGYPIWLHDPDARLEYWINAEDWLPAGDMLDSGSTVTAQAPLSVDNVEIQSGYKLIGWIPPAPTATGDLEVYFHIVSLDGRIDDRTAVLRCVQR